MKLDRNANPDGRGKYALVNLRILAEFPQYQQQLDELHAAGLLSYGNASPEDQFFVMRYEDQFTTSGLRGYADAVRARIKMCEDNLQGLTGVGTEAAQKLRAKNEECLRELTEWAEQIEAEIVKAKDVWHKLPD